MKRTPALALALTTVLAFGATACSTADDVGDAAEAVSDAASQAEDAASEAGEAATSAAGEAGDAASSIDDMASDASSAATSLAAEASSAAAGVDWNKYPDDLRRRIDRWVDQDNCSGLSGLTDQFPLNQDKDLQRYIETQIEQAGCA